MPEPLAPPGPQPTVGPFVRPANRSLGAAGSIHDDTTAADLGFRGGTVAGSIHLDHFGPLLVERYGPSWFERGVLSMYFRHPTTHLEPVRAVIEPCDGELDAARIETPDGTLVGGGDAGLAPDDATVDARPETALDRRDRRPVADPTELVLLADLPTGVTIDAGSTVPSQQHQDRLLADPSLLTGPIDWYRDASPWGAPVACPSVFVDAMWAPFERRLRDRVRPAVGLYGAIELRQLAGPLQIGEPYRLTGVVETRSITPRTEVFWARTTALSDDRSIAELVMMIRLVREPAASTP